MSIRKRKRRTNAFKRKAARLSEDILLGKLVYCYICGERLLCGNHSLDHVIPTSKGGTNECKNLQPCCLRCNSYKANRTDIEQIREEILSEQERKTRI